MAQAPGQQAMEELAADFLAQNPDLHFAALGASANRARIDAKPFGVEVRWLGAEEHPEAAAQFLALDTLAFPKLSLPAWVLSDLYLVTAAIGLLRGPARLLTEAARAHVAAAPDETAILAGYFASPTLWPGRFAAATLFSHVPGNGLAAWVKSLTLKMLGATQVTGVVQWDSPSLRVHTRLGPLRIVGPVAGGHALADRSFVYQSQLADEVSWSAAMARRLRLPITSRVRSTDRAALRGVLERVLGGEEIAIAPPGLEDDGWIPLVEQGSHSPPG